MDTPKITLKDWADEDKPREKLCAKGKKNLSNAELLAILLGSGSRGQSAVGLAKYILKSSDNSLLKLAKNEIHDLTNFKGTTFCPMADVPGTKVSSLAMLVLFLS